MTCRSVLQREPKLTIVELVEKTGYPIARVRTELTKLIAQGHARETVLIEYLGTKAEQERKAGGAKPKVEAA